MDTTRKKKVEIKKACNFVETPSGELYLPRPNSWISGWARHLWFQHCLGHKPSIAAPDFYSEIKKKHGECQLLEYETGVVRVKTPEELSNGA
jgi:hypothetical protein